MGWLYEVGRQGKRYIFYLSVKNWQLKPQKIGVSQNKKRKESPFIINPEVICYSWTVIDVVFVPR